MRPTILSAALVLLCPVLLAFLPANADPSALPPQNQPPHLLSSARPQKPASKSAKLPIFILNNHLERIPKTYMVYGLRSSIAEKMVCTDRLGHPTMRFPITKAMIIRQDAAFSVKTLKAAPASLPNTKQSAPRR